jgi:uncharacterized protein (DUF488 family)
MKCHSLFTTGYSGYDAETFLWNLRRSGVELIVDVRGKPTSRNPAFTQSRLKALLEASGFEYVHVAELGVPDRLRKELRTGLSLDEYLADYRKYLGTQAAAIDRLAELASEKACCLLCVENKPEKCHRTVLADVLVHRDGKRFEVVNI